MVSVPSSVSDFLSEVGFPVVDPSSLNVLCSDALIDSLSDNVRLIIMILMGIDKFWKVHGEANVCV